MTGINGAVVMSLIFSIGFPLGMVIWWRKRSGSGLWCFIAGALCFTVSVMVLERSLHMIFIGGENTISQWILASPVRYMLYAALSAGIFEETARVAAFRVLLRGHREKACAVAYGIGHGGMEILLLLGINYAVFMLAQIGVSFGSEAEMAQLQVVAESVSYAGACVAAFERISAMMIQIGLSMIVFTAVWQKGRILLYPAAILMHAVTDAPAALYQYGIIKSVVFVECYAFVLALVCLYLGIRVLYGGRRTA